MNETTIVLPDDLVVVSRSDLALLARGARHALRALEGLSLEPSNEDHWDAIRARKSAREVAESLEAPDGWATTAVHTAPSDQSNEEDRHV